MRIGLKNIPIFSLIAEREAPWARSGDVHSGALGANGTLGIKGGDQACPVAPQRHARIGSQLPALSARQICRCKAREIRTDLMGMDWGASRSHQSFEPERVKDGDPYGNRTRVSAVKDYGK